MLKTALALALASALLVVLAGADELEFWWHATLGECRTDLECSYQCPDCEEIR